MFSVGVHRAQRSDVVAQRSAMLGATDIILLGCHLSKKTSLCNSSFTIQNLVYSVFVVHKPII